MSRLLGAIAAGFVAVGLSVLIFVRPGTRAAESREVILELMPTDVTTVACLRPQAVLASPLATEVVGLTAAQQDGAPWDPLAGLRSVCALAPSARIEWICAGAAMTELRYAFIAGGFKGIDEGIARQRGMVASRVEGYRVFSGTEIAVVELAPGLMGVTRSLPVLERLVRTARGASPAIDQNQRMQSLLATLDTAHSAWGGGVVTESAIPSDMAKNPIVAGFAGVRSFSFVADCDTALRVAITCQGIDDASAAMAGASVSQMLGLARLLGADQPELMGLLEGIKVERLRSTVKLQMSLPAGRVVAFFKKYPLKDELPVIRKSIMP